MDGDRNAEATRSAVRSLRAEAMATNERRLVVLSGDRATGERAARAAVEAGRFDGTVVSVSERDIVGERVDPTAAAELLGTTHDCVVLDCHDGAVPNTFGQVVGTVDGGGLLLFVMPPLDEWCDAEGRLEAFLAAPPFSTDETGRRFKRRLVRTLRSHRGVAIVDVDDDSVLRDGRTNADPRPTVEPRSSSEGGSFPTAVYEVCRTTDQRDAIRDCEGLSEPDTAVVLRADRGRGKSSAAGLAAAAFAADGAEILVTAPSYRNAAELFERAAETLGALGALAADDRDGKRPPTLHTSAGGAVRFRKPQAARERTADVLFVDEAAALPVRTLEALLSVAPSTCFTTTVRGYEGAGRGFDVRFRDRLDAVRTVTETTLSEPIRHASADPIEVWLFHALLLGASPPPSSLLADASPADATYERLDRDRLAADETRLSETFGSLVAAHYRTEPNDLARLLDAPNVAVRALTVGGHVVSVALLSREGGLGERVRRTAYEGDRIDGNLVPDLLTSQLRDPEAGVPVGLRVMRIATHRAVRSAGFGSELLGAIEREFDLGLEPPGEPTRFGSVDYLATSYGVTPELSRFWRANGYRSVHLSATPNETSGEHSLVMLKGLSSEGTELAERHGAWFRRRLPGVLSGPLSSVDPDVIRAVLASTEGSVPISLTEFEWRSVASSVDGPGRYGTAPEPFRRLAFKTLLDGTLESARTERLLVSKALQDRDWDETAETLGFASDRACKRALGDAYGPIVEAYGTALAKRELERYRSSE